MRQNEQQTENMYASQYPAENRLPAVTSSAAQTTDRQALERFLAGVERRALVIAEFATRNRDDALDIVQDSMLAFARHYAGRSPDQWPPLFHRVLQNRIRDWHRRGSVRQRLFGWLGGTRSDDLPDVDPIQQVADPHGREPALLVAQAEAGEAAIAALAELPARQQQAFLLRVWEGLDVAATARAMGCSEGSVKTHLSRALASLRARLQDHQS